MKDNISVYKSSRAVRFHTYYRGIIKYFLILFCKLINKNTRASIFCFATRHQMLFLNDVIAHYYGCNTREIHFYVTL